VAGYEQAAGDFLRRLIPFPGTDVLTPLSPLSMSGLSGAAQSNPVNAVADAVTEPAASIVAQAASVLDDEMAKGVLTARRTGATSSYDQLDAGNPVLRQMHEVVDNLAKLWPSLQTGVTPQLVSASQPAAYDADALAEVRPRATVKPGQRATISMTLRNSENRAVKLVPVATDLLGSRGGRIASSLLECTPSEVTLQPQEEHDLTIATTVPVDAGPGCYSGLLVVRGLDYLRALITIEVV
jgi:hypothetical protein